MHLPGDSITAERIVKNPNTLWTAYDSTAERPSAILLCDISSLTGPDGVEANISFWSTDELYGVDVCNLPLDGISTK